jgi:LytS/YehU family sensor histidine kinase
MIYDCKADLVYLDKEIKALSDYIGLEKVRYGNRLNIEFNIVGNGEAKLIAPLLMIPFVENSFKHGTSKMLENPWIKMTIEVKGDSLFFELINSHPHQNILNGKKGIGLKNVQKRLELLYSTRYFLSIDKTEKMFGVKMRIPLQTDHVKYSAAVRVEETSLT